MVNVLVGNKNVREFEVLCPKLANDKNYKIKNVSTGINTLVEYSKLKPDILVLDNSLSDIAITKILDQLSIYSEGSKNCNTILTLELNNNIKLHKVALLHTILYKPIYNNELENTVKDISNYFNAPALEPYEVDELLANLNFNCMSSRLSLYERCYNILQI